MKIYFSQVYDSFVASFTEDEMNGKTFIRGGRMLEPAVEGLTSPLPLLFPHFCKLILLRRRDCFFPI